MHGVITFIANYALIVPIIGVVLVWLSLESKSQKTQFLIKALVGAVVIILLARVGSWLYYNPRPFVVGNFTPYFPHPNNNGFPSDHTLFTSYLALLVLSYNRKLGLLLLIVAATIVLARVIAGVHHLVDIVGAFALSGITVGVMQYYENTKRSTKTVQDKL